MLIWRLYRFSCTDCRKVYLTSLSPQQLGTGKRRCPNCAMIFRDGAKEWPELAPMQKFEYLFPTTVLGYFGGMIVVISFGFFAAADYRELDLMLGTLLLCIILPWLPYFLRRWDAIRSSKERFVRRQTLGSNEDVILPA